MNKILLLLVVIFPSLASAQTLVTRYGDTDCANNGDGTAASPCASSGGATGPYNSFENAITDIKSDNSNNLVTANVRVTLEMAGDAPDFSYGEVTGLTADATRYLIITTQASDRHTGTWDASKYIKYGSPSNLRNFSLISGYVRIDGLQIAVTDGTTDSNYQGIYIATSMGNAPNHISNNLFRLDKTWCASSCNNSWGISVEASANADVYAWNNIFYDFDHQTDDGCITIGASATGPHYLYNNTCVDSALGFVVRADTRLKNNIVDATTTCISGGTPHADSDYNSCACGSCTGGANDITSANPTYVNQAGDNYHLDAGDTAAKNEGVDLSADAGLAFSTDIDADTRSGTWDIGADETAGATSNPFSVLNAMGEV